MYTWFCGGNLRERDHLGDLGVDGRIILRWVFWKWDVEVWLYQAGWGYGEVAGSCEYSNELLGSLKCGNFLNS